MSALVDELIESFSVNLPNLDVKALSIETLMEFDTSNWPLQFSKDLQLFTFVSLLLKETQKRLKAAQDKLDTLESALYESIYQRLKEEESKAMAMNFAKSQALRDQGYQDQLIAVRALQYKSAMMESIVEALTKKGIVLNILAARERAEVASGFKQ